MNNTQPIEPRALIIGDVHGRFELLNQLLKEEGIIENGERVNKDVEVIQVGDLADFRKSSYRGDALCYKSVRDDWIDVVLWGNHDRAIRDSLHEFGGYHRPGAEIHHIIKALEVDRRMRVAYATHGYLITHAGLHPEWIHAKVPDGLNKEDPYDVADYLNQNPDKYARVDLHEFINNCGRTRGGLAGWGGVLWRDSRDEPLYDRFPQVFGHTSSEIVQQIGSSYCVDTSKHDKVSAIWLPSKKIVSAQNDV